MTSLIFSVLPVAIALVGFVVATACFVCLLVDWIADWGRDA